MKQTRLTYALKVFDFSNGKFSLKDNDSKAVCDC